MTGSNDRTGGRNLADADEPIGVGGPIGASEQDLADEPAAADEPAGRADGTAADEADGWRRLSPRMLVIHPFQELVRSAPALIGVIFAGSTQSGNGHLWSLGAVGLMIVVGTLRWFTTTYRVTPRHVQVRKGLIRKQVLTAPRDRIRTVDVTSHILHRLLGLARVEIGTGRSDLKDGGALRLDALRATEVEALREELLHRRVTGTAPARTDGPAPAQAPTPIAETELAVLQPAWIRYGPFTMSGLITVGVLAGFLSRLTNEGNVDLTAIGPVRQALDWFGQGTLWLQITGAVAALAVFVAVASTLGYVLAFWRFRLARTAGGTLHVTRGLITTRATTIEERRLRGVELSEPLLLRAVGGARCMAVTTGLRVGHGAQRGGSMLLPPAPREEALAVASQVLADPEPLTAPLLAHGPAALRRRFTRALAVCGSGTVVLLALWHWAGLPAWTWQVALVVMVATIPLAADRYRGLGHTIAAGHLVTRWGSLVRRRVALDCDGIIGWNLYRSFFQRRAGLATLTATTAAGHQGYRVWDVDLVEALRTADQGTPGLLAPFVVRTGPQATAGGGVDHLPVSGVWLRRRPAPRPRRS